MLNIADVSCMIDTMTELREAMTKGLLVLLREKMREKIDDEGRELTIIIESDDSHDMSFQRGIVTSRQVNMTNYVTNIIL